MIESPYVVFLDIDGVFTSARVHLANNNGNGYSMWHKFDPIAIDFMNHIHDKYNVEFVLISTWKNDRKLERPMDFHWVAAAFANAGFRGKWAYEWFSDPNNVRRLGENRANEIVRMISEFGPNVKDFIIFDDTDYGFNRIIGKKRWIRTTEENGLTHKNMLDALSIMGTWDAR